MLFLGRSRWKMKSEAELKADLEKLQAEIPSLLDKSVSSPEVQKWINKVFAAKAQISVKKH
jgi:hypothetical protein